MATMQVLVGSEQPPLSAINAVLDRQRRGNTAFRVVPAFGRRLTVASGC